MNRHSSPRTDHAAGTIGGLSIALLGTWHGLIGLAAGTAAMILVTAITALAPELFWLCALRQPSRDLFRLLRQFPARDAERLCKLLNDTAGKVTAARTAGGTHLHESGSPEDRKVSSSGTR